MALSTPIYLDYAATTPVDPLVADAMAKCLTLDGNFGNPASRSYRFGWMAEEAVDVARNQISDALNCDPREIVFTSGATESNNFAIKSIAKNYFDKDFQIITVKTEHKCVLESCHSLENENFEVHYLEVDDDDETTKLKSAVWHNSNPQKEDKRSLVVALVVLSSTLSASLPSSSLLNSLRDTVDENIVKFC